MSARKAGKPVKAWGVYRNGSLIWMKARPEIYEEEWLAKHHAGTTLGFEARPVEIREVKPRRRSGTKP